jgi:hypothetical protein
MKDQSGDNAHQYHQPDREINGNMLAAIHNITWEPRPSQPGDKKEDRSEYQQACSEAKDRFCNCLKTHDISPTPDRS